MLAMSETMSETIRLDRLDMVAGWAVLRETKKAEKKDGGQAGDEGNSLHLARNLKRLSIDSVREEKERTNSIMNGPSPGGPRRGSTPRTSLTTPRTSLFSTESDLPSIGDFSSPMFSPRRSRLSSSRHHPLDVPDNVSERRRQCRDTSPVLDLLRTGRRSHRQFNRELNGCVMMGRVGTPRGDAKLHELCFRAEKPSPGAFKEKKKPKRVSTERATVVHGSSSMDEAMRKDAIQIANNVLDGIELPIEMKIARAIEEEFDLLY